MSVKDFFIKIASSHLWGNLLAMLLLMVLLAVAVKFGTDIYTRHGKVVTVPNVEHKQLSEAKRMATDAGMKLEVVDTGYVKSLPPDCILTQSLIPGDEVKPGRVLMVTVNASSPKTIALPDIIDNCSYREAEIKLRSMGFKVGSPQFVPGEREWVYGIVSQGRKLKTGDRVSVEDMLILQVGSGSVDPNENLQVEEAEYQLRNEEEGNNINNNTQPSSPEEEGEVDEFEIVTNPEAE